MGTYLSNHSDCFCHENFELVALARLDVYFGVHPEWEAVRFQIVWGGHYVGGSSGGRNAESKAASEYGRPI